MKTLAGIALAFGLTASGNAILIDNFTTGPYTASLGSGSVIAQQTGSMIGGQRDVMLTVLANGFGQLLQETIGSGMAITSSGTLLEARVGLEYDGFDVENPTGTVFNHGAGFAASDWSAQSFLRINFLANDRPLDLRVDIEGSGVSTALMTIAGNHDTAFTVDIPLSSFAGTAALATISHATFLFETSPSGDFGIGSIEVVPEPSTLLAAGVGLILLCVRRRK